jgi:hypothetical protein
MASAGELPFKIVLLSFDRQACGGVDESVVVDAPDLLTIT